MASTDTGFTDRELEEAQNTPIHKIDEYLYLGNVEGRRHVEEHQIKWVIRLTTQVEMEYTQIDLPTGVKETIFQISDDRSQQITPVIIWALHIIEASIKRKERVLVHCEAGVSRSASVAIAHIMKSKRMCAEEALKFVEKIRCCVWPNKGFWKELTELSFDV